MARAQGAVANAKEDTVYFAETTITTDKGQLLTNLTVAGAGGYELNSTRTQLTSTLERVIRWTATAAEASVVLLALGDNAQTNVTGLATTAGGSFCIHVNNTAVWTAAAATAAKDYTLSWSMRDNPDTTGASDAKISEAVIYNHTDGVLVEISQVTHAVPTVVGTYTFSVGGWWNGAALTNVPTNAVTKARVSRAWHPSTEVMEDWVAARTAYAGSAADGIVEPLGPLPVSSALGDSGRWAGRHPYGYAAAHTNAVERRSWSPLVNESYSDAQAMTQTPAPAQWATAAPGGSNYTLMLNTLRWVPVPLSATHAWVRVHVVSWVTAGGAVPVGVRAYAFNRLPGQALISGQQAPALEYYFVEEVLTVDHGAGGTGEWLELGYLRLPKFGANITGWQNTVHLALAYDVDPAAASGNDANARLLWDAWHARPAQRPGVAVFDP